MLKYASFRSIFVSQSLGFRVSQRVCIPSILKWCDATFWFRLFRFITGLI